MIRHFLGPTLVGPHCARTSSLKCLSYLSVNNHLVGFAQHILNDKFKEITKHMDCLDDFCQRLIYANCQTGLMFHNSVVPKVDSVRQSVRAEECIYVSSVTRLVEEAVVCRQTSGSSGPLSATE